MGVPVASLAPACQQPPSLVLGKIVSELSRSEGQPCGGDADLGSRAACACGVHAQCPCSLPGSEQGPNMQTGPRPPRSPIEVGSVQC